MYAKAVSIMDNILTYEKLQEVQKLLKTPNDVKADFFNKYFPTVEDCSDWIVILPKDERLTDEMLEHFPWIKVDEYATKGLTFNPKTAFDDIL